MKTEKQLTAVEWYGVQIGILISKFFNNEITKSELHFKRLEIEVQANEIFKEQIESFYKIVDFGDGDFVANKKAIPLLKALNEIGLRTRSHHITDDSEYGWFTILLDNVDIEIVDVYEANANRTKYNGKKEIRITFKLK